MPKRDDIHKVLLIGSGPIQIGQAAEFDFSGSQACKSLREEGIEVVLVNSNPATIMTDPDSADKVYIEPLVPEIVAKIIEKERPDGIIAGIGGQTGLNITSELSEMGVLEKYNVEVLGTSVKSIREAEDRDLFKKAMQRVGEPVPKSVAVNSMDEALAAIQEIELDRERILSHVGGLIERGVDVVAVSTAHGHSKGVGDTIRMLRDWKAA